MFHFIQYSTKVSQFSLVSLILLFSNTSKFRTGLTLFYQTNFFTTKK